MEPPAKMAEMEEQYRRIFEATSDSLVIFDMDGVIVEANPVACRLYGYDYDEMIGLHLTTLVTPEDNEALYAARQSADAEIAAGSRRIQAIARRKDGRRFHIESHVTTFTYKGRPHLLTMARDVSEQVQARELLEQRVAERTRELSSLLALSRTVAGTLERQPLLDLILDSLASVVAYDSAAILTVEDGAFVLVAARGPDQPRPRQRFPIQPGHPIWDAIHRQEALVIPDIWADTPLASAFRAAVTRYDAPERPTMRSWLAVPLALKDRIAGLLSLSHARPDAYTAHQAELAQAIASQAAVAIENARLYGQAQEMATLHERQRLARELHDSVSQALYGIALGARTARTLLDRDPAQVAEPLDYVLSLAEAGLTEMRALIFELLPEALANEGLVVALRKQLDAVRARHGVAVVSELGTEPQAPHAVKEALYRIGQEALHNAVKHARAHSITVRLESGVEGLMLEVADDGVGFDPGGDFPGHLGLQTMRDRATRLHGTLQVESAPGHGTCIRAVIPLGPPPA